MDMQKARKLSKEDMVKEINKVKDSLVQLQSDVAMHRLKNHRKLRDIKKYLARLLTIQKEQEILDKLSKQE